MDPVSRCGRALCLTILISWWLCARASGQVDPLTGIDFARVGAPNNPAFPADPIDPNGRLTGRGGVSYDYRIGRTEVPSSLWAEFFTAALARTDRIPWVIEPSAGGAFIDVTYTGPGRRYISSPGGTNLPCGGISWRTAAIFCNWLNNDKSNAFSAFMNGAYDVSTFGPGTGQFTDQLSHTPGARYWIPSLDEWLKAGFYDPAAAGNGRNGWWLYPNGTNIPMLHGMPPSMGGVGQSNAGFDFPDAFGIPLGAYTTVQSPWGLYDVGGATSEWTEGVLTDGANLFRPYQGSHWTSAWLGDDRIRAGAGTGPNAASFEHGLRLAASQVPAPGVTSLILVCCATATSRRRRPCHTSLRNVSQCSGWHALAQ